MKKNVVFWIGVKNETYSEKYGGWDWLDISRKTWEFWCKKHDCIFYAYETPKENDVTRFRVTWQRWFDVFNELDNANIEYDQIYLVDGMNIIRWDAPNIFKQTENKFVGWRDIDNLNWIQKSKEGYKKFFNNFELDLTKYVSAGLVIFNASHRKVLESFKNLYYNNIDELIDLQDNSVRKGTDQTPLNYWLQKNKVDIKTDLSLAWKFTHMHRKELYFNNWQLKEDDRPHYMKYGYVWNFSGFPKNQRTEIMSKIWNGVKHNYDENYFLNKIPHKDIDKDTTSRKFKEDLLETFYNKSIKVNNKAIPFKDLTLLELGCNKGYTTRVYAECFQKVIAVEHSMENLKKAKDTCSDVNNVEFIHADVYNNFNLPKAHVVSVDAGHNHDQVCYDIDRCINELDKPILIFDDICPKLYPNGEIGATIGTAIDQKCEENKIDVHKFIGEYKGYTSGNGKSLLGREGMIVTTK